MTREEAKKLVDNLEQEVLCGRMSLGGALARAMIGGADLERSLMAAPKSEGIVIPCALAPMYVGRSVTSGPCPQDATWPEGGSPGEAQDVAQELCDAGHLDYSKVEAQLRDAGIAAAINEPVALLRRVRIFMAAAGTIETQVYRDLRAYLNRIGQDPVDSEG